MTDAPDNEGIIEDYVRVSNSCDSEGVLMEIIGNRKHNPEKCDTKFILAKFIMDGISYFILYILLFILFLLFFLESGFNKKNFLNNK
jgi:hypothetical protein